MQCDKCHQGQMHPTKVFRLSGCLVAIGFIILIPCFVLLCFAVLAGVIGTAATGSATITVTERAKQETVVKLQAIEGLPAAVVSDFQLDARISDETFASLTSIQSNEVRRLQSSYDAMISGAALGTGFAALFGGGLVIIMFVIAIPGLIVGFVLILRKKVWRCQMCGYIFDRA
jgi:hypothetical protein